jgi:hypothetical protein
VILQFPELPINDDDSSELRERLRKMSDQELLRFGTAAKFMCSSQTNFGKPSREAFVTLDEARAEWKRRKPDLPLNTSV